MPIYVFDMPEVTGFVWAWAVGGSHSLADGDGIALGGDSDAPAVVLQIHYDNYMQKKDLIDPGSGIRVTYDVKKPTNEASVLGIGSVALADFSIPGDTANYTIAMQSRLPLLGDVEVYGWALHMHEIGVRIRSEVYRQGKLVSMLGCLGYASVYGHDNDGVDG